MSALHPIVATAAPLTYFQAVVLGLLQGVTELFPVSSLGHTVLFPKLFGWHALVRAQSASESFWLAFVVMLHVGSALGLLAYYWREWIEIISGFVQPSDAQDHDPDRTPGMADRHRQHPDRDPRPRLGASGAHADREAAARLDLPRRQRLRPDRRRAAHAGAPPCASWRSARAPRPTAGVSLTRSSSAKRSSSASRQSSSLVAGISRDGVAMGPGLARGLDHSDAARFAFLLATPIILAAGLFKLPDLTGHLGNGIRGQAAGRMPDRRRRGGRHGSLPGELVHDAYADAVRGVLPAVRPGDGDLQLLSAGVGLSRQLRIWLPATVALFAAVVSLAGASASSAATPYIDGISDQNLSFWNGDVWNGGPSPSPFGQFLTANLVNTRTAPLRYARYVVAYDVMCDRSGPAFNVFRTWLEDVRALGLTPVVGFWYGRFDGNACATLPEVPATLAQYNDPVGGVAAFLHSFPQVRVIEAWNEPNNGRRPDVPPARAAAFWAAARTDCATGGACTVIAGDFNDAEPNLVSYERHYVAALGGVDPLDWGIHPYEAVNSHETATLSAFSAGLPNAAVDRVWYTEVGAWYCTPKENARRGTPAATLQAAQALSAHYLVSTLMQYPFMPVHVFYYEFMYKDNLPGPCADRDSALYEPAGTGGSSRYVPRAAIQDILPAATFFAAPQPPPAGPPGGRLVYYPVANWQLARSPWQVTSY